MSSPTPPATAASVRTATEMNETTLNAFLSECRARIEKTLERLLPAADAPPPRLHQAMRYAVLGGGKRVRPTLAYAAARAVGMQPEKVDTAAAALEMIHVYSLIHDDLPAMDDDDLRRGRPSCHRAFDEATAILAGDALQTHAFQVLATDPKFPGDAAMRTAMIGNLARAAGSVGMAGGQALDLESEGKELDLVMLENIHIHKTGALIRSAINLGALTCPGLAAERTEALDHYAKCIGLAFQIQDDLLDVEGNTAVIGKHSGADAKHHKATYPSLMGIGPAHEAAADLVEDALKSLESFSDDANPLRWIARYIISRDR
jgi:geranylgeranyl pyrophosphate synthase